MKSILKTLSAVGLASMALTQSAFASGTPFTVPEPGSMALVGLAAVAAAFVLRKKK